MEVRTDTYQALQGFTDSVITKFTERVPVMQQLSSKVKSFLVIPYLSTVFRLKSYHMNGPPSLLIQLVRETQ